MKDCQVKDTEIRTYAEEDLTAMLDRLENEGANKATLEQKMFSYLERRARNKGVPIKGTFELTPLCNLDCKMCYVHLTPSQMLQSNRCMISTARWKQIMQDAIDHGMIYALLTGGEALLHPDFDELYLFLCEHGVQVKVNTNGLLLTADRIDFFRQHPPAELHITLYGADEDTYERVTGHRVFGRVWQNILAARDAGIRLCVGITPSKYIQNALEPPVYVMVSILRFLIHGKKQEEQELSMICRWLSTSSCISNYG